MSSWRSTALAAKMEMSVMMEKGREMLGMVRMGPKEMQCKEYQKPFVAGESKPKADPSR